MSLTTKIKVLKNSLMERYSTERLPLGNFILDYCNKEVDLIQDLRELLLKEPSTVRSGMGHFGTYKMRFAKEILLFFFSDRGRILAANRLEGKAAFLDWTSAQEIFEQDLDFFFNLTSDKDGQVLSYALENIYLNTEKKEATTVCSPAIEENQALVKEGRNRRDRATSIEYHSYKKYQRQVAAFQVVSLSLNALSIGFKDFNQMLEDAYSQLRKDGRLVLDTACFTEDFSFFSTLSKETRYWYLFQEKWSCTPQLNCLPLNWKIKQLEKQGFRVEKVENKSISTFEILDRRYDKILANRDLIIERYGQFYFRAQAVTLAWTMRMLKIDTLNSYRIVAHKI